MSIPPILHRYVAVLSITFCVVYITPTFGQIEKPSSNLESEVAGIKAENAALREQVRKLEEQQSTILQILTAMQHGANGQTMATPEQQLNSQQPSGSPGQQVSTSSNIAPASTVPATVLPATTGVPGPAQTQAGLQQEKQPFGIHYDDGLLLYQSREGAEVPFRLKVNDVTQFRYTNTLLTNSTFTDHLGTVRTVLQRNDFGINRNLLMFNGYAFSPRFQFNILSWASNTLASVIEGGEISYQFSKGFILNTGYWGVPGSRTLTYTFPYFVQADRSMADNFFRPGFTQGIWATGEPLKGLNYDVFLGNGINTLTIPTTKVDTNLVSSGSVWWEPLGPYGPAGRARNMYDDYYAHQKPSIRVGGSFTRSRENRFSNLDQSNPENTSMYNSDGVLTFSTGAFAPNVTVQDATYRMLAIDGGYKYKGLALNGQYYWRWVGSFNADGPIPIASMFDHGFELSASGFPIQKKLELYGRTSFVFGQFRNSYELGVGLKYYPVRTHRISLAGEGLRVDKSPVGGILLPYNGGMVGWAPTVQLNFNF